MEIAKLTFFLELGHVILSLLKQKKKIGQSQFVVLKFLLLISMSRVCTITVSVGTPPTSLEIQKKIAVLFGVFFFFFNLQWIVLVQETKQSTIN